MKLWQSYRFSIRDRFIALVLMILLPLVSWIIIGRGLLLPKISRAVNDIVEEVVVELGTTAELQNLVSESAMAPNDFLLTGAPRERQNFIRLSKAVDKSFKSGSKRFGLAAEDKYYRAAMSEWRAAKKIGQDILNQTPPLNTEENIGRMRDFDKHTDATIKNLNLVNGFIVEETVEERSTVHSIISQISVTAALFLIIALLIAIIIGVILSRSIIKPLKKMEVATGRLSSGDLTYRIDNDRDDELGRLAHAFNLMADRLERSYKAMQTISIHDQLTGLYNRRETYRRLNEEIRRYRRYGHSFSLMMLDIDRFKNINDEFGHQVGDSALYFIAQAIQKELRPTDHLCRYGGDEFIAILPETRTNGALAIAERAHRAVAAGRINVNGGPPLRLTITIGIADFPADADSVDEIVAAADQAMFNAKKAGRNQIRCFHNAA